MRAARTRCAWRGQGARGKDEVRMARTGCARQGRGARGEDRVPMGKDKARAANDSPTLQKQNVLVQVSMKRNGKKLTTAWRVDAALAEATEAAGLTSWRRRATQRWWC